MKPIKEIKIDFYKKCIAHVEDQLERTDITEDKKQRLKEDLKKYKNNLELLKSTQKEDDQDPENIE